MNTHSRFLQLLLGALIAVCTVAPLGAAEPDGFLVSMMLDGGGLTEALQLDFGMDSGASDAYDSGLDLALPPPPPAGYRATLLGSGTFPNLRRDIRATNDAGAVWRLRTQITNGEMTVNWGTPVAGTLDHLPLRFKSTNGGPDIDMRSAPSIVLTAGGTQTYWIVLGDGGNRAPVAVDDAAFALSHPSAPVAVDIPVLRNDSDPDGHRLAITALGQPTAGGTVVLASGGRGVRYTPAAGFEGADSFTYTISDDHLFPATASAIVTVQVGAPPAGTPVLTVADADALEGNSGETPLLFLVTLSVAHSVPVSVDYATADGTATVADADYRATTGTLTFAPGETQKTIGVPVLGDTRLEADELFVLDIMNPVNAVVGDAQALGTIRNDDLPTLSVGDRTADEGNSGLKWFSFSVTLSEAHSATVTVDYATADGTATIADNDYIAAGGTLTFAPGQTSKTINVQVVGDSKLEADETFTVTLSNPTNATILKGQGIGTIRNDDTQVVPVLSMADVGASEGNAGSFGLRFVVTLSASSATTVTVDYATADGTATVTDGDYTATSGQLSFAPGQTEASLVVQVHGDTTVENDETFHVDLSNPVNATLAVSRATGTIVNDDSSSGAADWSPPGGLLNTMTLHAVVRLGDGSYVGAAGSKLAVFKSGQIRGVATIFDGPASEMQFQLSVGSNSSAETGLTLQVYDAASGAVLDVNETLDFVADGTVGMLFSPQLYTAGTPPAPGSSLSIADVSANEGNSGQAAFTFTVTLSAPSTATVTVDYATADGTATAGSDYVATSGQLTFAPGEIQKTLTVQVMGDTVQESDEQFFVNLTNPINAPLADAQGVGTIVNDDMGTVPSVTLGVNPASIPEAGGVATVTATLSAVSAQAVTVNLAFSGTATNGVDYTRSGTQIVIAPGSLGGSVTVTAIQDALVEPDETVVVDIDTVTNGNEAGTQRQTLTIIDDDTPVDMPTLSIADVSLAEGHTGNVGFQFTVTLSAASASTVTVSYATADGTATVPADYVAASGTLTFAPGETAKTITVQVVGDTMVEPDETFTVSLSNSTGATLARAQAVGTIRNDDSGASTGDPGWEAPGGLLNTMTLHAVVRLGGGGHVAAANSKLAVFKDGVIRGVATVFDGPAAQMQFQLAVGSNVGNETGLTLRVYDAGTDLVHDIVETIDFTADATLGTILAPVEFTTTTGGAPTLPTLSIADVSLSEGNTGNVGFQFTVTLSAASATTVTVGYATADGTATVAGGDYSAASGTLSFAPGQTQKTITVLVLGDTTVEPDETFVVNLSNPVGATLARAQATGTIRNDDAAAVDSWLTLADAVADEGETALFRVTLAPASQATVTVAYATVDGTATVAGGDYSAASGTLSFAPGETVKTIAVPILTDGNAEPDETFSVQLFNAAGAQVARGQAAGLIRGDQVPWYPSVELPDGEIVNVRIRRNDGTLVLNTQVATVDAPGLRRLDARDYKAGTGPGRMGLTPGAYTVQTSVWNQDFQEFELVGSAMAMPTVAYAVAAAPGSGTMSSSQVGSANRNWGLDYTGTTVAQGCVIEVRNASTTERVTRIVQEFLPEQDADAFPVAPLRTRLALVPLGVGSFEWRLRFFTPLDPPETDALATNWSAWRGIVTLTPDSIDSPRKPALPAVADRWYWPESGAVISAAADTGMATIAFEWSPVLNATGYYVHVATREGRVAVNRQLVHEPRLAPRALEPGEYYWAVRPANTELGAAGIADAWMAPFPLFAIVPVAGSLPNLPGLVAVSGIARDSDGYVRLSLTWTGHVAPRVRLLVLTPGFMLEPDDDRDAAADRFTTDVLDAHLSPGQTTLVKAQGVAADGTTGPWGSFVPITIPARP